MFQLKNFVSITASMLNHMRGTATTITDFIPGSTARTLIEAPAIEIEELYLQVFTGLKEAIPVATFRSFNFTKTPAAYARGRLVVSRSSAGSADITIPVGTVFSSSDGRQYLTTVAAVWPKSTTSISLSLIAAGVGAGYNISAGSITTCALFSSGYTIINSALTSGKDVETDPEQEARFADYIASLSRGTIVSCLYAVKNAYTTDSDGNVSEYVTRVGYTETQGYVQFFIYSSAGLPSADLIAVAQSAIDGYEDTQSNTIVVGYRAAGVRMDVLTMVETAVPLTATVTMLSGYSLDDTTTQLIIDAFESLLLTIDGGAVLYVDDIEVAILSVVGVSSVRLTVTSNIVCGSNEALVPGVMTVVSA